jgi:hypothetical protein
MESLSPKNHAERVAIFRHTVIGRLLVRDFAHGELRAELEALSRERFRPPEADLRDPLIFVRDFSLSTQLKRCAFAHRSVQSPLDLQAPPCRPRPAVYWQLGG